MTTSLDNFRAIQQVDRKAQDEVAAQFITDGSMATEILVSDAWMDAALVYSANPTTPDTAHLYVPRENALNIGTIFATTFGSDADCKESREDVESLHYFIIVDEVFSVKHVHYHEYNVYECNTLTGEGDRGYITTARYINTRIQSDVMEVSLAKPLLVLPGTATYAIGDILHIGNRVWRILEIDDYTSTGINYYSLESFVAGEDADESTLPDDSAVDSDSDGSLCAGTEITVATEDGYFTSTPAVKAKRTPTQVTFTVPFTSQFSYSIKENGEVITMEYEVIF